MAPDGLEVGRRTICRRLFASTHQIVGKLKGFQLSALRAPMDAGQQVDDITPLTDS